jgi:uncharacterized protein YegP (UPF0339 family)
MPIEFWKTNNGGWFWTTRSPNGEIIADSAEVYSSRSKAVNGAHATAAEFLKWRKENKLKTPKAATSARSKPAGKRSALSKSSQIRKTGRLKG